MALWWSLPLLFAEATLGPGMNPLPKIAKDGEQHFSQMAAANENSAPCLHCLFSDGLALPFKWSVFLCLCFDWRIVCVVFHAHLKGCGYVSHRPEESFAVWVFDRFLVSLGQHWCCVGLFDFTHAAVMWKTDHKNHNWVEQIERPQCFPMALTFIRCLWSEWPEANNGSSHWWYAGCTHGEKECQSSFFALP